MAPAGWGSHPAGTAGSYNPSSVYQVTIHITSDAATSFTAPTIVYVDSIRTASGIVNDTFDTSIGNMVTSSLLLVTGSTFPWISAIP